VIAADKDIAFRFNTDDTPKHGSENSRQTPRLATCSEHHRWPAPAIATGDNAGHAAVARGLPCPGRAGIGVSRPSPPGRFFAGPGGLRGTVPSRNSVHVARHCDDRPVTSGRPSHASGAASPSAPLVPLQL